MPRPFHNAILSVRWVLVEKYTKDESVNDYFIETESPVLADFREDGKPRAGAKPRIYEVMPVPFYLELFGRAICLEHNLMLGVRREGGRTLQQAIHDEVGAACHYMSRLLFVGDDDAS
jgi:hypothetical protein